MFAWKPILHITEVINNLSLASKHGIQLALLMDEHIQNRWKLCFRTIYNDWKEINDYELNKHRLTFLTHSSYVYEAFIL
jgi:hypothetical protein